MDRAGGPHVEGLGASGRMTVVWLGALLGKAGMPCEVWPGCEAPWKVRMPCGKGLGGLACCGLVWFHLGICYGGISIFCAVIVAKPTLMCKFLVCGLCLSFWGSVCVMLFQ
jgi:hypothetical protein